MKKLLFIRHGESIVNVTKEFSYKKVDKPLTEKGILQAEQTGKYLKKNGKFGVIFSSPLLRALETAEKIKEYIGDDVDLVVLESLRELNVGDLEDMGATREAWELFYHTTREWINNPDHKFPGGESLNELRSRFRSGIVHILNWMENKSVQHGIIVAHGGILYSSLSELFDVVGGIPERFEVPNCSITTIQVDNDHENWVIPTLANFDHIYGEAREFERGIPSDGELD